MTTITVAQRIALAVATGRQGIESARQEATEADALLNALEERVRAGDPAVTPTELGEARQVAHHAGLRVEAAQRRADTLATETRRQVYADYATSLQGEAEAIQARDDAITAAFERAFTALSELWTLAEQRTEHRARLVADRSFVAELARQHDEKSLLPKAAGAGLDAPAAELAAMPLESLLNRKHAESRLSGAYYRPWSPDLISVRTRKAAAAFPALAPRPVEMLERELRAEIRRSA